MLINEVAAEVTAAPELTAELLRLAKRHGFSDDQIGKIRGLSAPVVRGVRQALGVRPVYKTVDTCAAEFAAATPYHYSSYDEESEVQPREKEAVIILGSGPNRIGQGIEFDYSCVHASLALSEAGYETVMVNCNPETVSTDYDTSDRLYFEPLTLEDVLEIVHAEEQAGPVAGVICQLGGQTPLGLAHGLEEAGVRDRRHLAGRDPPRRGARRLRPRCSPRPGCRRPSTGWRPASPTRGGSPPRSPTRCWCGRRTCWAAAAWRSCTTTPRWSRYIERATEISPEHPVLVDRFIDDAVEIDVDAIFDGEELFLGGVMEHIEEAGIHSGDSSCALPPITLGAAEILRIREATEAIARGVGVRRADQHPVRAGLRRALRARGQPAGQPHRAVRLEGDRDPAGQGRGPGDARRVDRRAAGGRRAARRGRRRHAAGRPADRGQGGGDAVQPVPHPRRRAGRHGARARR